MTMNDGSRGDFDFLHETWDVAHHYPRTPDAPWEDFQSRCTTRPSLGGLGNIDLLFRRGLSGCACRAYHERMEGSGPSPQVAAPPSAAEVQLLAGAEAFAEAIVANDADRISEFVTDDWVIVSDSGVAPGQQLLDLVRSGELTHSAMQTVGKTRIRIFGDVAVLTARITNTAHYAGQQYDADEWTTDIFVHRGGRWRCVHTHYTSVTPIPDA